MAGRPTQAERHLIAARRQTALGLRLGGADYLSIGRKLAADPFINSDAKPYPAGYGVERYESGQEPPPDRKLAELVKQDLWRVLRDRRGKIRAASEQLVELHDARLERLLAATWKLALTGDPAAVTSALRILERQAKLHGLDSPNRTEVSGPGGGAVQLHAVTQADREEAIASVVSFREDQAESAEALTAAESDAGDTGAEGSDDDTDALGLYDPDGPEVDALAEGPEGADHA